MLGLVLALAGPGSARAALPPALPFVHGPYQDVTLGITRTAPRIPDAAWAAPPGQTLTWAFATGDCGHEHWGDFDSSAFAQLNVEVFRQNHRPYIIATGGEAGIFTCDSDDGMARFVARYDSPLLVGVDFDIEGRQTPEQIGALVRSAAAVQRARPALRFSFTLATHAASDGTRRSLNATGEQVLAALAAARFDSAVINLMVMNYGPADARWCVLRSGASPAACDMGRSALQAARNVHEKYGIAFNRIALTAMPGENDVAGNVFTTDDAAHMAAGARALGLAGLHWWSLNRDQPCPSGSERVSSRCHGLPGVARGRFGELLGAATR
jgi:hypothetical protein